MNDTVRDYLKTHTMAQVRDDFARANNAGGEGGTNFAGRACGMHEIDEITEYYRQNAEAFAKAHQVPAEIVAQGYTPAFDKMQEYKDEYLDSVARHFGWDEHWAMLEQLDKDWFGYGDEGEEAGWELFNDFSMWYDTSKW